MTSEILNFVYSFARFSKELLPCTVEQKAMAAFCYFRPNIFRKVGDIQHTESSF